MSFTITPQGIKDVLLIAPRVFADQRGFFLESFRADELENLGLPSFVQENHSRSTCGVLRGLHYQLEPVPLGKLVRCGRGAIFDVAVDIREGSPTYGKWAGATLDDKNHAMLFVPAGFAHGFLTLSETADVFYKQSDYYAPQAERGIAWNDPDIGIVWPTPNAAETPILSQKDASAPNLANAENNLRYHQTASERDQQSLEYTGPLQPTGTDR